MIIQFCTCTISNTSKTGSAKGRPDQLVKVIVREWIGCCLDAAQVLVTQKQHSSSEMCWEWQIHDSPHSFHLTHHINSLPSLHFSSIYATYPYNTVSLIPYPIRIVDVSICLDQHLNNISMTTRCGNKDWSVAHLLMERETVNNCYQLNYLSQGMDIDLVQLHSHSPILYLLPLNIFAYTLNFISFSYAALPCFLLILARNITSLSSGFRGGVMFWETTHADGPNLFNIPATHNGINCYCTLRVTIESMQ